MRRAFITHIGILLGALFGLVYWHNCWAYQERTWKFKLFKSCVDWSLITLLAWRLPAMLVAWGVYWLVRPIKDRAVAITISVFAGMALSSLNMWLVEGLCLISVFAVDLITGTNGFMLHHGKARAEVGLQA